MSATDLKPIYRSSGDALEYASWSLNLYGNCSHQCRYCYNQDRTTGLRFDRPTKIATLSGIEHALKLMEDRSDMRHVHLSFLGDIYDLGRKDNSYTRQVLDLFRRYRHPFQVLTKGGLNAVGDFDLYFDECRYGATLTFIDESDSLYWEPKSALPAERLESLEMAKAWGIKTWVSCEPVIDPAQTLELIREAAPYVDFFAIGKINHYPDLEAAVNWRKFKSDAETLLQKLNKPYLIKNKLKAAAIWQEAI